MTISSRVLAGAFAALLVGVAACGGDDEHSPGWANVDDASTSSSGAATSSSGASTSSSGGASSSSSSSGSTVEDAGTDAESQSDASASCTTDLDCNGDSTVSTLQGTCQLGLCMCNAGFVVQPSGACGSALAPSCSQQAGTCKQDPAACPTGEFEGEQGTNMSCGDLVAAVCCFDPAACRGIVVACVAPDAGGRSKPLCVNGWRTCPPGTTPTKFGK